VSRNGQSDPQQSMRIPATILVPLVIAIGVVVLFVSSNTTNVQAPAGYAAYIVNRPIIGRTAFDDVITGPSSTGLSWRLYGDLVSVTPYSYSENFGTSEALIAKDKLAMTGNAHIVFRIRGSKDQIRLYMEDYGGLDETHNPDAVAQLAYANYIKEPFRTLIREEFAAFDGLDVPDNVRAMGKHIASELTDRLSKTPFEVLQVVIGNAQPPQVVLDQIAFKVAKTQELARKATEQSIADANKNIEKANGEAAGEKDLAVANKRAEANRALASSLTPELLQYNAIEAMKGSERIYVPIGPSGLPLVTTIPDLPPKKAQP
jgi:regulator of protease activity HflC (stomatin/prohibitin superfamily)